MRWPLLYHSVQFGGRLYLLTKINLVKNAAILLILLLIPLKAFFFPLPVTTTVSGENYKLEDCQPTELDSLLQLSMFLLKDMEGLRLKSYKCPGGMWTIGYGHTKGVQKGMTITEEQADSLLLQDFTETLNQVDRLTDQLDQGQRYAVAIFLFNVGPYRLKGTRTLRYIKEGSEPPLHLWVHAKGKKLRGLKERRQIETEFFRDWRCLFKKTSVHLDSITQ